MEFLEFIKNCPSCFHAVRQLQQILDNKGFLPLKESDKWELEKGKSYYVTRNDSSIIAFSIGATLDEYHFQITSSHSDSPTFKVKENGELEQKGNYLQLNVEGYGGMICSTWMDRPLSLAGRVLVKENDTITSHLFDAKEDMVLIPNVPIHLERNTNSGYSYNVQVDMLPLFSAGKCTKGDYLKMIAKKLDVEENAICGKDIYLYNRQQPSVWGFQKEFISAAKLDDLECAYASFTALSETENKHCVRVAACFDNEEVGSLTKQGADSTFMEDVLKRITIALNKSDEEYYQAIAKSFMVSCDNAHALHPNHPEKFDATNYTLMNKGVVIKHNANQTYTSDAFSKSVFELVCEKANVPVQHYANRSDERGGSTLGNLSNAHVSLHCVDIGVAQLAMHSSYESAGYDDIAYLVDALKSFYTQTILIAGASQVTLK